MSDMSDVSSLDDRWYHLLFGIRRSIRYHQRRRGFFDRCDQLGNVVSLIFGSAAIYGVLDKDYHALALVSSGLVTVLSAVNLVFGSAQRARAHHDLARKFTELESQMLGQPTEEALKSSAEKRLVIEADEPPVLRVLDCLCHNEQMRSEGYSAKDMAKIRWWQRCFAQVMDLREDLIQSPA
ncbi:hypothetical protein CUJ91_04735 [Paraburkholderia graminis]|uniref:hypothetical protein n=1 Tax=Paraburkholderia graminis TaxID=60548 RepID=UPI000DEEDB85|nr:hypothetical protein [Paraburkholderia graminis]AXF07303.1 hypothetical protein CUJ91_04735 [Paraburkholderia graminis]